MPLYDYRCLDCGHLWEARVGIADEQSPGCPTCGGRRVVKQIGAPAVVRAVGEHGGARCCGREERCERPPCGEGGGCCGH